MGWGRRTKNVTNHVALYGLISSPSKTISESKSPSNMFHCFRIAVACVGRQPSLSAGKASHVAAVWRRQAHTHKAALTNVTKAGDDWPNRKTPAYAKTYLRTRCSLHTAHEDSAVQWHAAAEQGRRSSSHETDEKDAEGQELVECLIQGVSDERQPRVQLALLDQPKQQQDQVDGAKPKHQGGPLRMRRHVGDDCKENSQF